MNTPTPQTQCLRFSEYNRGHRGTFAHENIGTETRVLTLSMVAFVKSKFFSSFWRVTMTIATHTSVQMRMLKQYNVNVAESF